MQETQRSHRIALYSASAFVAAYAIFFFPFAFFRHDDWLMLGNAILRVPENWMLLFKTSWFDNGVEHTWFFRPFFKLAYYVGYQLFGFAYYGWLSSMLGLVLVALFFAYKTVLIATGSGAAAAFAVVFFTGSFHFHLGSLLWAGEGFMNVPVVTLLSLSSYTFVRYVKVDGRIQWQLLSILFFILSLGFKEASFTHGLLLAGLYFYIKGKFEWLPKALLPHAILTIAYLIIRLGILPLNPFYQPKFGDGLHTLAYFAAGFGGPYILLLFFFGRRWSRLFDFKYVPSLFFCGYLFLTFLPHQGHPFFSPGWLLHPGFFFSIILAVTIREPLEFKLKPGPWLIIFALSAGGVVFKMKSVEWWKWGEAQKQMHTLLQSISPEQNHVLRIRNCSPEFAHPDRILGYRGAISDWYEALHGKTLNIQYVPCETPIFWDRKAIWYDWNFPKLTLSIDEK